MNRIFSRLLCIIASVLLIFSYSCKTSEVKQDSPVVIVTNSNGNGFIFELSFEKGKKHHYPLMAVWIEDAEGNFIQTLFVAQSVAKGEFQHATARQGQWVSGPLRRAATLPYWAHKQNRLTNNPDPFPSPENPVPDAYSGATPSGNFILNSKSDSKLNRPFRVWFEINQFFDFNDFWTNNKYPDDKDYKTSGQPALVYASDIINPKEMPAEFTLKLIGHSHWSGKDGSLYTSLQTMSTALDIVKEIRVKVREK